MGGREGGREGGRAYVSIHEWSTERLLYLFSQRVQYLDLHKRLMVKSLFVSDDLDGYWLVSLVVVTLQE